MTKSRNILKPRAQWTPEQIAMVVELYPHQKTEKIAQMVDKTSMQVYCKAASLGLKKTPEYMNSPDACRLRRGGNIGAEYRFQKGQVPPNKGIKGISYPGMVPTQFKPGSKPKNWMPIGSERYSKGGYLQRKLTDTGYPPRDWVSAHSILWRQHYGDIPVAHRVCFKDGNKQNIVIENLELVSIADVMRRNTIHNLPKPLKEVIQLTGYIKRRINTRRRKDEQRASGTK